MFNRLFSSKNSLSPQESLDLARLHLENARKEKRPKMAMALCNNANDLLSDMKRTIKKSQISQSVSDQTLWDEVAVVYFEHGQVLDSLGQRNKAQVSYQKVADWGGRIQDSNQLILSKGPYNTQHLAKDGGTSPVVTSTTQSPSSPPLLGGIGPVLDTEPVFPQFFTGDMRQPVVESKLPKAGEILRDTTQLTYSLSLLQSSPLPENELGQAARDWLKTKRVDPSEQERLQSLATDVVRSLGQDELKNSDAVEEVVFLAPVLMIKDYQNLLGRLVDGLEQSVLLNFSLLEGLAQLIQNAGQGYLEADDLVKILGLISKRLQDTHGQSTNHIYRLTQAASNVLDAMADSHVSGLDRVELHAPLLSYLDELQNSSDPYLVYQAAYAFQALQYVKDNETPWQTALRRGGNVLAGIFGMVGAVKGLNVNSFIEGLKEIQDGVAGVGAFFCAAKDAYDGIVLLSEKGQTLKDSLVEAVRFNRKRQWYRALRGADTFLQCGQLVKFQKLVYGAPCRLDPAFQWGVCERLGKIAANPSWDVAVRQRAVDFLGEIYRNDRDWGQQIKVKQWIFDILIQLASLHESNMEVAIASEKLLKELEGNENDKKQAREINHNQHPLKVTSFLLAKGSSSLLDRVQHKAAFMADILRLKQRRLELQSNPIYIPPQAKASLKARNDVDALFPLMSKVKEFLKSDKKVFLVLGDSGSGKSTFNLALENDLWGSFDKNHSPIPLYIHLPAIDRPEHDLIAKQLRREHFKDEQIKELKECDFILICDGYDESQQTNNLYTCNLLNQPGQWRAQMIISCRSEYLDQDYLDSFQTTNRNQGSSSKQFQEAVIAPFSENQIQEYIEQYVSMDQRPWQTEDYHRAFKNIPQLSGLVRNPFLLALSMEVLPSMVDQKQDLSTAQVTRVSLYDNFVEHWMTRGKKRLQEKTLGDQERKAFKKLTKEGFKPNVMKFLKDLSVSTYEKQAGNPVIEYIHFRDVGTWKENFFSESEELQILREVCPLTRTGDIYNFIHRSILEYGIARAVFDPEEITASMEQASSPTRRGSLSSVSSLESQVTLEEIAANLGQSLLNTPLARNNLVGEPSILHFLEGRAQQEPLFRKQLLEVIERSKTDKAASKAAANAITILVRSGVKFNGADLRGIQIPRADLTGGQFDSAQLQGSDLRKVNLRNVWLSQADLSGARMAGAQFGELPYLKYDDRVTACAYSKDGKLFAVGLDTNYFEVYSISSWEKIATMTCNSDMVFSIAFSPMGDRIISCCSNKTIQLWDVETGACLKTLSDHSDMVISVVYSPSGDQFASGSRDGTVRLWDAEAGECVRTLSGHSDWVHCVDYSPDGSRIVSGGRDKTVRVWSIATGECFHTFESKDDITYSEGVLSVTFLSEGNQIASSSNDNTVRLWDIEAKLCRHILRGHTDLVRSIAFLSKLNQIVSGSDDKTLRLWDVDTGACLQILSGHTGWVMSVACSISGSHIASTSGDGTVRLWDAQAKSLTHSINTFDGDIEGVHILPNGNHVASRSRHNGVHLWNFETGTHCKAFNSYTGMAVGVQGSSSGDGVVYSYNDKTVHLWNIESGDLINTSHCGSSRIAFSPNGDIIAFVDADDLHIFLWDLGTDKCCRTLESHGGSIWSLAYSPDGNGIVTGGWNGVVQVLDTVTGACRHTLTGSRLRVECVTYSTKGDQIATGGKDRMVRLWIVKSGECLHTLHGHSESVLSVIYSPNDNQIASGSEDMTVRIWDVKSGQCRAVIRDFHGAVNSIAWKATPDGIYLVAGSSDKSVRLWKVMSEGDKSCFRLCWSTTNDQLTVNNTCLNDVEGLSLVNEQLLRQRGAVSKPLSRSSMWTSLLG